MTGPWPRVRGLRAGVAVVAAVLVVLAIVGDLAVPMFSLGSMADLALPVSLVAPVAIAIFLPWSLGRGDERLEGVAVRPVDLLDAALALLMVAGFAAAAAAMEAVGLTPLGIEAGRNGLGLAGMALAARWLSSGEVAGLVPVAYVIAVGFFGGDTPRTAEWWAWLVRPGGSAGAALQPLALLGLGLLLTARGRRRRPALR